MSLRNILWDQVSSRDSFEFKISKNFKWKFIRKNISATIRVTYPDLSAVNVEYLCFRSMNRADYKELFDSIAGTIKSTKFLIQEYGSYCKRLNMRVIFNIFTKWFIFLKLRTDSFLERLYVYVRICGYLAVLHELKKTKFEYLLVFSDMQPLDNLLVQYFRNDGKVTITMQHGLYVDYGSSHTINTINYLHQPAQYFLAWGNDTKKLINKYHPDTCVVICGKPLTSQVYPRSGGARSSKHFTVVFDQNLFEQYNVQLLLIAYVIAQHTGLKINLRLHPWNHAEHYDIDRERVEFDLDVADSKFVIGHTSSLIYELLRDGVPAFKLRSNEHCLHTPEYMNFSNAEELLDAIPNFENMRFETVGREFISFRGEESLREYSKFFHGLKIMRQTWT